LRTAPEIELDRHRPRFDIACDLQIVLGRIWWQDRLIPFEEFLKPGTVKDFSGLGKEFQQFPLRRDVYPLEFNTSDTILHLLVDLDSDIDGCVSLIDRKDGLRSHIHVSLSPVGPREILHTLADFTNAEQIAGALLASNERTMS
jgi:hypothetical protein